MLKQTYTNIGEITFIIILHICILDWDQNVKKALENILGGTEC